MLVWRGSLWLKFAYILRGVRAVYSIGAGLRGGACTRRARIFWKQKQYMIK